MSPSAIPPQMRLPTIPFPKTLVDRGCRFSRRLRQNFRSVVPEGENREENEQQRSSHDDVSADFVCRDVVKLLFDSEFCRRHQLLSLSGNTASSLVALGRDYSRAWLTVKVLDFAGKLLRCFHDLRCQSVYLSCYLLVPFKQLDGNVPRWVVEVNTSKHHDDFCDSFFNFFPVLDFASRRAALFRLPLSPCREVRIFLSLLWQRSERRALLEVAPVFRC